MGRREFRSNVGYRRPFSIQVMESMTEQELTVVLTARDGVSRVFGEVSRAATGTGDELARLRGANRQRVGVHECILSTSTPDLMGSQLEHEASLAGDEGGQGWEAVGPKLFWSGDLTLDRARAMRPNHRRRAAPYAPWCRNASHAGAMSLPTQRAAISGVSPCSRA